MMGVLYLIWILINVLPDLRERLLSLPWQSLSRWSIFPREKRCATLTSAGWKRMLKVCECFMTS
jgi:hypothetical protein